MPVQRRKKGVKGQLNTPTTEYGELKKPVQLTLTPTAIASLDQLAAALGISRSELVEQLARIGDKQIMELLKKEQVSCDRNNQMSAIASGTAP